MVNLKQVSKRIICRNFRKYFRDYCLSSTIHGMKYFGERQSNIERGWWFIILIICLSTCAYTISLAYQKWDNNPVIVSFDTRDKQIYEIPFPAVTICPEKKTNTKLYSHSKMLQKIMFDSLSEEEYKHFSYMILLCENLSRNLASKLPKNSSFDNYFFTNEFYSYIFNVTPNILNSMHTCSWNNKRYQCSELFDLVLTDEGVCATFNMMDKSEIYHDYVYLQDIIAGGKKHSKNTSWTLDKGYSEYDDIDTFPRRALIAGATNSLQFSVKDGKKNVDFWCKSGFQGFKVALHIPIGVPRPSQQSLRIPLNEVVVSSIKPIMVTTSETVKKFKPEKRGCYFQNEINLKYFKQYTQMNCQLECLTNFTLEMCNCVAFFMPKLKEAKICGPLNTICMLEAEQMVQKSYLRSNKKSDFDKTERQHCKCLPLCTDLSYDVETSTSNRENFDLMYIFPSTNESIRKILLPKQTVTTLIMYFKANQFVSSKRHEMYGPTDFLANFGGLLGLFTGFSIISLVEIIYFLTVRIICNIRSSGNWAGNKMDLEKNI